MKVIGYRLDNEYEKGHIISTKKFLMVIECCGLNIREYGDDCYSEKTRKENNYRVYIRCSHPTVNYFIISNQLTENRFYKWLTLKEAEEIVECATTSDIIDLRELGDYHICNEERMQTVTIMNEYDEFDDEPVPIVVKTPD